MASLPPPARASMDDRLSPSISENFAVFVNTSIDTHLVVVVSPLDSVGDLKRTIKLEHALCFPDVGEIVVQSVKVQRGSHLYHLSDSIPLRKAFEGDSRHWFLEVDVFPVSGALIQPSRDCSSLPYDGRMQSVNLHFTSKDGKQGERDSARSENPGFSDIDNLVNGICEAVGTDGAHNRRVLICRENNAAETVVRDLDVGKMTPSNSDSSSKKANSRKRNEESSKLQFNEQHLPEALYETEKLCKGGKINSLVEPMEDAALGNGLNPPERSKMEESWPTAQKFGNRKKRQRKDSSPTCNGSGSEAHPDTSDTSSLRRRKKKTEPIASFGMHIEEHEENTSLVPDDAIGVAKNIETVVEEERGERDHIHSSEEHGNVTVGKLDLADTKKPFEVSKSEVAHGSTLEVDHLFPRKNTRRKKSKTAESGGLSSAQDDIHSLEKHENVTVGKLDLADTKKPFEVSNSEVAHGSTSEVDPLFPRKNTRRKKSKISGSEGISSAQDRIHSSGENEYVIEGKLDLADTKKCVEESNVEVADEGNVEVDLLFPRKNTRRKKSKTSGSGGISSAQDHILSSEENEHVIEGKLDLADTKKHVEESNVEVADEGNVEVDPLITRKNPRRKKPKTDGLDGSSGTQDISFRYSFERSCLKSAIVDVSQRLGKESEATPGVEDDTGRTNPSVGNSEFLLPGANLTNTISTAKETSNCKPAKAGGGNEVAQENDQQYSRDTGTSREVDTRAQKPYKEKKKSYKALPSSASDVQDNEKMEKVAGISKVDLGKDHNKGRMLSDGDINNVNAVKDLCANDVPPEKLVEQNVECGVSVDEADLNESSRKYKENTQINTIPRKSSRLKNSDSLSNHVDAEQSEHGTGMIQMTKTETGVNKVLSSSQENKLMREGPTTRSSILKGKRVEKIKSNAPATDREPLVAALTEQVIAESAKEFFRKDDDKTIQVGNVKSRKDVSLNPTQYHEIPPEFFSFENPKPGLLKQEINFPETEAKKPQKEKKARRKGKSIEDQDHDLVENHKVHPTEVLAKEPDNTANGANDEYNGKPMKSKVSISSDHQYTQPLFVEKVKLSNEHRSKRRGKSPSYAVNVFPDLVASILDDLDPIVRNQNDRSPKDGSHVAEKKKRKQKSAQGTDDFFPDSTELPNIADHCVKGLLNSMEKSAVPDDQALLEGDVEEDATYRKSTNPVVEASEELESSRKLTGDAIPKVSPQGISLQSQRRKASAIGKGKLQQQIARKKISFSQQKAKHNLVPAKEVSNFEDPKWDLAASSDSTEDNTLDDKKQYRVAIRKKPGKSFFKSEDDPRETNPSLVTPSLIFDVPIQSSEDDVENSNIKTLPENSSSSNYSSSIGSDDYPGAGKTAEISFKSRGTKSGSSKGDENAVDSSDFSELAAKRRLSLGVVLKGSNSYRKAKLSASQQQQQEEDVVFETQAD